MTERLLVIGGDAAGMSAASQAKRVRGDDLDVVVFEKGGYTSYAACGLPYFVSDLIHEADQLIARSPEQHRANGIDARTGHEVLSIDTAAGLVVVRTPDGSDVTEHYDQLVIATGASPVRPRLPGVDAAGVFGIQTIRNGIDLRAHLDDRSPRRAVVVGGGYIGLEMAEAMQLRGLEVTVVEQRPEPMGTLDPDMGHLVADAMRRMDIELHTGVGVVAFDADDTGHVRAVMTEQGTLEADVVVLGLGVRPNSGLAHDAGIPVGITGGIATDRRMATGVERVWAAGDCVETFHRVSHLPVNIALGTHANKQGRVVGVNATGGYLAFPGVIGTAVTKICELEVARTGLNERECQAAAFDYVCARINASTRAHYYPDAQEITVKVIAERRSGRLLGAQIVGREGAAKRIDVLAAAIWNEMTADEFSQLDLGYAPPFSPVWDSTLIAARKAADQVSS